MPQLLSPVAFEVCCNYILFDFADESQVTSTESELKGSEIPTAAKAGEAGTWPDTEVPSACFSVPVIFFSNFL